MTADNMQEWISEREADPNNKNVCHVQWKGSAVCIDFTCACGNKGHFDKASFAYFVHCPKCDRYWAMDPMVRIIEMTEPEHIAGLRAESGATLDIVDEDAWLK